MIVYIIIGVCLVLVLLFFLPIKGRKYEKAVPERNIDERDTMFSRNEIKPGDPRFEQYYKDRPENKDADDKFRSKPGLTKEGTTYYNRFAYAAADASFEAVESFFVNRTQDARHKTQGAESLEQRAEAEGEDETGINRAEGGGEDPSDKLPPSLKLQRTGRDPDKELSNFIISWAKKMGAHSVGIAEMKDYHFYTLAGRRERYGKPVDNNHKYGIALTVEMDYEMTMPGPQAPIVMESARQYLNSGMIATQLALTLRNLGYEATTHIDANYDVICPLVAKDAGLGEIGRMGLLMTPALGSRVRIAVVTTDAPLEADNPAHSDSMLDFCTRCKKCAHVCPSSSISNNDRIMHKGGLRWQIDQEACFTYWCQAGTDCGRCMAVCPYSHKDNALHRFARWGINNNYFFRQLAVVLDDVFYGRKPKPKKNPDWL